MVKQQRYKKFMVATKTREELEQVGWKLDNSSGLKLVSPYDNSIYIREPLIRKLGQEVKVSQWHDDLYLDVEAGYVWPQDCLYLESSPGVPSCECGAKYTSFPDLHIPYCAVYKHQYNAMTPNG